MQDTPQKPDFVLGAKDNKYEKVVDWRRLIQ